MNRDVFALLSFGVIAACGWAYFGFPIPGLLTEAEAQDAKNKCVAFADESRDRLFPGAETAEIHAFDVWTRRGKTVVEVGAIRPGERTYRPRLCVVGMDRSRSSP